MASNTPAQSASEPEMMVDGGALWGAGEWRQPSLSELQTQEDEIADALEAGLAQNVTLC